MRLCSFLARSIGLVVASLDGCKGVTLLVALRPETEVETSIKKLTGQRWLATESMDGPPLCGAKPMPLCEKHIIGTDTVDGHRHAECLAQRHLCLKDAALPFDGGSSQSVETTFAELHHFGERQQTAKAVKMGVEVEVVHCRPPWMDTDCIHRTRLSIRQMSIGVQPSVRTKQHLLRQTDNACTGRCVYIVRVEIHNLGRHLYTLWHHKNN